MFEFYDTSAAKKATNLSVNSDLLAKAKAQKINLSATLEEALQEKLIQKTHEQWKRDNANALKANVDFIETHGYFGSEHRVF